MSAPLSTPDSWLRRHWIRLVVAVFLIQLALIWFLSDRSAVVPRADPRQSRFQLITDPATESRLANALVPEDPALFASANRHGFSGAAWLSPRRTQFKVADWNEPQFWLAQQSKDLSPAALDDLVKRPSPSIPLVSKVPPRIAEVSERLEATPTQSTMRIEGRLAHRRLARPVTLPAWTNTTIVRPNTIEAVVSSEGEILSTRLLVSSGMTNVDQEALRISKEVRFTPEPSGVSPNEGPPSPATVGWLVFDWATVAPPKTNPLPR